MDQKRIDSIMKKLEDISKRLANLDPSIRKPAFEMLAPLYFEEDEKTDIPSGAKGGAKAVGSQLSDAGKFFKNFSHDKPKDNVHLISSWLYSQYGTFPITVKDIEDMGAKIGLIVPERPDKTMAVAKANKKSLYRKVGSGYELTVHGEAYMQKVYNVKMGKKARPAGDKE